MGGHYSEIFPLKHDKYSTFSIIHSLLPFSYRTCPEPHPRFELSASELYRVVTYVTPSARLVACIVLFQSPRAFLNGTKKSPALRNSEPRKFRLARVS